MKLVEFKTIKQNLKSVEVAILQIDSKSQVSVPVDAELEIDITTESEDDNKVVKREKNKISELFKDEYEQFKPKQKKSKQTKKPEPEVDGEGETDGQE